MEVDLVVRSLVVGAGGFQERFIDEDAAARGVEPFDPLPSVAAAVEDVARALREAGMEADAPLLDPDPEELDAAWHKALDEADRRPLVVHFSGHGEYQRKLYLAVRGSERGDRLRESSVDVEQMLEDAEVRRSPVLFLLDVCEAGRAVEGQLMQNLVLAARQRASGERYAWVIGACAAGETTQQAKFSRATASALRRLSAGWLDVSPASEYVPLKTFAADIACELAQDGGLAQSVVCTPDERALAEVPGFLPNPAFARDAPGRFLAGVDTTLRQLALATDPALDLLHFATRAAGNSRADVCQFSGRTSHLARIQAWLEDSSGHEERLLVVTGGPGTGKSALLGVTACLLHPALAPLRARVRARVTGFNPRPKARILAVHARQLTLHQITEALLRQLPVPDVPLGPHELAPASRRGGERQQAPRPGVVNSSQELAARIRAQGPVVIILDALDEAVDPAAVTRELILPLTGADDHDEGGQCRIMVGTRPWWDILRPLHELITAHPRACLPLDPDSEDERQLLALDLAEYLSLLLDDTYPRTTPQVIADRLAHHARTGAFLIAAVYADHLLQQAAADQPSSDAQILTRLPCDITAVFDLQTETLAATKPWVRDVLAVLGRARGQGMPLELLHAATLAHAGKDTERLPPSLEDTRHALTRAAFYLRTAPDSDQRLLYRFFHQALTNHCSPASDPATLHRALINTIPRTTAGTPDWDLAHPYLKRHAAEHAADADDGALDELLESPLFLLHADPDILAPRLHHARTETAVHHAHIYRTSTAHHHERHDISARRDLLALDAAAWRKPEFARTLATAPIDHHTPLAVPVWATNGAAHPALLHTVIDHAAPVRAAATAVLPGKRAVAVTGGGIDGRLLVSDLATGEVLHTLKGNLWGAWAAATAVLPDNTMLAIASGGDGRVGVWDLTTGEGQYALVPKAGAALAVSAAVLSHDRAQGLMGLDDGRVLIWDLRSGRPQRILAGHTDQVRAAATAVLPEGPALALTLGGANELLVWDMNTGRLMHSLTGGSAWLWTVAAVAVRDGRALGIASGVAGQVPVWDLLTGELVRTLTIPTDTALRAVTATVLPGGRALAIAGSDSGEVPVWDLDTGKLVDNLTGPTGEVTTVAADVMPDGRTLTIVSVSDDRVRVWAPISRPGPLPLASHTRSTARADASAVLPAGRAATITRDFDLRVRFHDLATGEQLRTLTMHVPHPGGRALAIAGHHNGLEVQDRATGQALHTLTAGTFWEPNAVASVVLPGGHTVAITGDDDGRVLAWDLITGSPLGPAIAYLPHKVQVITPTAEGIIVNYGPEVAYFTWTTDHGPLPPRGAPCWTRRSSLLPPRPRGWV
ncbi:AAA family ATPase [Streptomyces sp. NPDC004059]